MVTNQLAYFEFNAYLSDIFSINVLNLETLCYNTSLIVVMLINCPRVNYFCGEQKKTNISSSFSAPALLASLARLGRDAIINFIALSMVAGSGAADG